MCKEIYLNCKTFDVSYSAKMQSQNPTYDRRSRFFHTFQGLLIPLKNSGIHIGKTTASLSSFLASTKSAMSSLTRKRKLFDRFRWHAKESLHSTIQPTVTHWLSHKSNAFSWIIYILMAKACNNYNWHLAGRLQLDAKAKKAWTISLEHHCQYSQKDKQS